MEAKEIDEKEEEGEEDKWEVEIRRRWEIRGKEKGEVIEKIRKKRKKIR